MTNKEFIEEKIKQIDEAIKYKKSLMNDRYDSEGVKRLLEQKKQFESIKNKLEILEILKERITYEEIGETQAGYMYSMYFEDGIFEDEDMKPIKEWLDDRT